MRRLRVLLSAYACEPGKGSEPGVGWNVARHVAEHHDVWVLTRSNNREAIEAELAERPVPGLRFAYHDLPRWARAWKRGPRGVQAYYYLWQIAALPAARALHREVEFDLGHHVTFAKYWAPSFLPFLPIPFVWGPVGGGESAPASFRRDFGPRGRRHERMRDVARWLAERDPLVRLTVRRSAVALASTNATRGRLEALGAREIEVMNQSALAEGEVDHAPRRATNATNANATKGSRFRVASVGNLLHWKAFHLGVRAFARAAIPGAEYWIIGDGPERARLEALARSLGVESNVRFFGELQRSEAIERMARCDVLVHPSLHDSGGFACLEAMACGIPVVCLDRGGTAVQVTPETGRLIPADTPERATEALAAAIVELERDPARRAAMGRAARRRVFGTLNWKAKAEALSGHYRRALSHSVRSGTTP